MDYYCIMVKTGGEEEFKKDAERLLKTHGASPALYFFKRKVREWGKRRGNIAEKPMFPGYVFLGMDEFSPSLREVIVSAKNFYRFLPNNSDVRPLHGQDLDYLEKLISYGEEPGFSRVSFDKNDRIVVHSGVLSGFVGNIVRVDRRKKRVTVRLDMFSTISSIDLCYDLVEKVDKPPKQ